MTIHVYIFGIFQKGLEPREIQTSVGSGTAEILFNFVNTLVKLYSLYPTACVIGINAICIVSSGRSSYSDEARGLPTRRNWQTVYIFCEQGVNNL